MPTVLDQATEKRQAITKWMATAIGIRDAEEKGLVRISAMSGSRNWNCREAIYDFAQEAKQADPVLVRVDEKRVALYALPASSRSATRPKVGASS